MEFVFSFYFIIIDSCDCEEFGHPLAKRINGLNLLQAKVVIFYSKSVGKVPNSFQDNSGTEGSEKVENHGEVSPPCKEGQEGQFSAVYPFPQGNQNQPEIIRSA